jgi:uncharacterized protein YbjT (DUF2867 family)
MKIVVIGGTGLIGSETVTALREEGHEAIPASPATGVNTLTGEGLAEALEGARAVIDVANSPSFEDEAAMDFFTTSTANLLEAEAEAGVHHHVALSVVGSERMVDSGYMRAKVAQENLIRDARVPWSLVRATQFYELSKRIAESATEGDTVRLPEALVQPIAAEDVAAAVTEICQRQPASSVIEIGGPEVLSFEQFIGRTLRADDDPRKVRIDPGARYFGAELEPRTLLPTSSKHLGTILLEDWLNQPALA